MGYLRKSNSSGDGGAALPLLVLFTVAAATLGFEILLTRVFALVLFASHSFVAISLAMLGTGAGALAAHLLGERAGQEKASHKLVVLAVFAGLVVLAVWVTLQVEFVPQEIINPETGEVVELRFFNERRQFLQANPEQVQTWKLYAVIPIVFSPFLVSGYLQALLFRESLARFGLMYGVDLIGATVGSILVPLLLYPLGLRGSIYAVAFLSLLPLGWAALRAQSLRRTAHVGIAAVAVLCATVELSGTMQLKYAAGFSDSEVTRTHWTPMARVGVLQWKKREMYTIDNTSRTWYAPNTPKTVKRYRKALYTVPMQLRSGGSMLIIASGGGQEITMAHRYGFEHIDAVEIAGSIIDDILENRADDPGNPYLLPGVHWHRADGRSVAMRADRQYDMIEMKEVNFMTLSGQISQVWSPYFIFTQEAFSEYFRKLEEDGLLCYTIFSKRRALASTASRRRFASLVAGLRLAGVEYPGEHLLVAQRPFYDAYRVIVVAKQTPWTDEELDQFESVMRSRGEEHEIVFPLRPHVAQEKRERQMAAKIDKEIRRAKPRRTKENWSLHRQRSKLRREPVTDDKPYMENSGLNNRITKFGSLLAQLYQVLLATLSAIVLVFIAVPFVLRRRRRAAGGTGMPIRLILILVATGLGFMFVEMAAIFRFQLYLHHPTIAMMVVLSSMILGAGLGSLHSERCDPEAREKQIAVYSLLGLAGSAVVLLWVPQYGHRLMLSVPMWLLLIGLFALMTGLGFMLGHVVPLSMKRYIGESPQLVPYAWALAVTGSVYGAVGASILSRELGMTFVALLGLGCYAAATLVAGVGVWWTRRGRTGATE